jgi:hypothetical protein
MPGQQTPWGEALSEHEYAEGIVFYETGRHGGFKLTPTRNAEVHQALRNESGWYEEDCEALKVLATFPKVFETENVGVDVEAEIKRWFPREYRSWKGATTC